MTLEGFVDAVGGRSRSGGRCRWKVAGAGRVAQRPGAGVGVLNEGGAGLGHVARLRLFDHAAKAVVAHVGHDVDQAAGAVAAALFA